MQVCKDRVVTIEYKVVDREGNVIDTTDDGDALSFIQGRAAVFPALEEQVEGHRMGERLAFTLEPAQAYGERDESLVRVIPREQFNKKGEIHEGMTFITQKNDKDLKVIVTAVTKDEVTVDANHPLAGVAMNIDLVILDVRDAIDEELESGEIQEINDIYMQEQLRNEGKPPGGEAH